MSDQLDEEWTRPAERVPPGVARAVGAVRVDLARLHAAWMGLAFDDGHEDEYSVVESRAPRTTRAAAAYRFWTGLGALPLVIVYPLFVVGLATRFYSRRVDRFTAGLGLLGVALLSLLGWGTLTVATYLSPVAFEGFVAVAVAGVVATVSAVLARYFTGLGGRAWTVALGYPFGVTALFLPPVVAALYSPTLASVVFPRSTSLAVWLLDNVLAVGGVAAFVRASFELEGVAYVGMWFGLAVPTGWVLGTLVTLATAVRRTREPNVVADGDGGFV